MKQKLFTLTLLFVLPPLTLWLLFSAEPVPASQTSTIVYVNQAVVGGNNSGTSWADAYSDLQTALAASPPNSDDELWVAAGLYKPTSDTDREATFQLKSGVALYGGFAGTETERDQRDWAVNFTVLSGDIDNNDITTPAGVVTDTANIVGGNSYHVVTGSGVTSTAVLDGFILTAGNAYSVTSNGGGMYNNSGNPGLINITFSGNYASYAGGGMYNIGNSNPSLANVMFDSNSAVYGGGMYNWSSSPSLTNVTFSGNSTVYNGNGGGMFNFINSNPSLSNITFNNNSADYGGGMFNAYSSPILTNVTFSRNSANWGGGGMDNGGSSSPSLTNVTFSRNSASSGGGMYNEDSSPSLTNVTFSENSADGGGGIYNRYSSPSLTNVTFSSNLAINEGGAIYNFGGTVTVTASIIANSLSGSDCAGDPITSTGYNIDSDGSCNLAATGDMPNTDPLLDPLADNGGYTLTHMPRADSPAIDAGDPLNCPPTDQRGVPRPHDGDGDGDAVCDIGSVEYSPLLPLSGITIQGPITGSVQTDYTFTAVITPISATQPITYVWQTAGQTVTHTGGVTDTAVFSWNTSGAHVLTVTASNPVSSVTASATVTILEPQYLVYLPVAIKP